MNEKRSNDGQNGSREINEHRAIQRIYEERGVLQNDGGFKKLEEKEKKSCMKQ